MVFGVISGLFLIFGNGLFLVILGSLLVFILVYATSLYFINKFLFEKINPLYRTVLNSNLPEREIKGPGTKTDIIKQVKSDVEDWENNKKTEIDQLKQLEKYRREFLGNVSHELKTPIFNIQGYILTLLDGGLEDPSINRLYLERSEKSINRMINIVEDLESISRLESGELKLEMENFDIVALVNEVCEMQEMLTEKYKISLEMEINSGKQWMVNADKKRITEVLNNLIVNSIKYGKKNGKTKVSVFDMDDRLLIEVSDTGIGIAEKDIPRIFERFYRSDKSRSRDHGGTGLGLSIVKHIIEAHRQTLNVRSKLGEGSSFSFTLNKAEKED
jgi:two-component system phosphate regulon sensor histidine kinase PhoR